MNALRITDDNWQALIQNFEKKRVQILSALSQKGHNVSESDGFLYIDGSGIGNYKDTYVMLQEGLTISEYEQIAAKLGLSSPSGPDI